MLGALPLVCLEGVFNCLCMLGNVVVAVVVVFYFIRGRTLLQLVYFVFLM